MNTIICPECGKEFEISKALTSQIEQAVLTKEKEKHKQDLEDTRKAAEELARKKVEEEVEIKFKDKENEALEAKERNKKLQEQLLEMTRMMRDLKEKDEVRELEMQKQLDKKTDEIREQATKKAEEEQGLKLKEKDKQLQDTLKELEDAKRKLTQGSQQAQGEVFEQEFETLLQQQYPNDKILPVGTGVKGGDIVQEVWDSTGNYCGKILWELKNTKTWSEGWVDKLKQDKRAITADDAVIISMVLPPNMKKAGWRNGVWVTERQFVFPLADTLRAKLIELFRLKISLKGKDVKMEALYNYLTGIEFKNRVEAIVEAFTSMQDEIEKEKRYFSNKWARDEKYIRQVIDNTYGMHGDLKGILAAAVPQIVGLDQPALVEDNGSAQKSLLDN
jgi:hypothetical protein